MCICNCILPWSPSPDHTLQCTNSSFQSTTSSSNSQLMVKWIFQLTCASASISAMTDIQICFFSKHLFWLLSVSSKCTVCSERIRHILEHWWPHTDININIRIKDAHPDLLHIVAMTLPRHHHDLTNHCHDLGPWTALLLLLPSIFCKLPSSKMQHLLFRGLRCNVY